MRCGYGRLAAAFGILAALAVLAGSATAASRSRAATVSVVMRGLDNPRGLAFGPKGGLYVVEAGRGGTGPCVTLFGMPNCFGASGAISRLYKDKQERVVTGLPSIAGPTGEAAGPNDVVVSKGGGLDVAIGLGLNPAQRGIFGEAGRSLGSLVHVRFGRTAVLADVAGFEATSNPAGGPLDTNPFGLLATSDGWVVADAAGNDLLRIGSDYSVSTIAVFPSRPGRETDSVPTAVASGPSGTFYVGELTGVPFAPGSARIYRVRSGSPPEIFQGGFTAIIDLTTDSAGNLWVVEHASAPFLNGPGALVRITPTGTRTTVVNTLDHPSGVVVGPDGALYVSNKSTTPGVGEVLKIVP